VLRVLDPEASILRSVLARDALEDIELESDRSVPNGMHENVQP
jgi:hypothetical protein